MSRRRSPQYTVTVYLVRQVRSFVFGESHVLVSLKLRLLTNESTTSLDPSVVSSHSVVVLIVIVLR